MAFFCIGSPQPGSPVLSEEQRVLVLASGNKFVIATTAECSSSVSIAELSVSSTLLCAAVSPSNNHIAACTEDKTLAVWKRDADGVNWPRLGGRSLPKRAMVVRFTSDEQSVVVGDKTGEAYLYSLADWTEGGGGHLLGHFSMLLDMVLSPSNSHVISCDRDEKIRVSKFPNSYNIECFCLGHTEFVSTICVCPKWPHLLLSGSGDGSVKVWEWLSGRLLSSEQVGREVGGGGEASPGPAREVPAVTKVCCSSQDPAFVITSVEKSSQLVAFLMSSAGALSLWGHIQLQATPWDITLDWDHHLWACLHSEDEPVVCYQWKESKLIQTSQDDSPLLKTLNNLGYFENVQDKDWSQMRKNVVDNMGLYLARKEERLKAKPAITTDSTTLENMPEATEDTPCPLPSQEGDTNNGTSKLSTASPPYKKSKLET